MWLSRHFCLLTLYHWADPRSLATTSGISVDFFSSGYWDVSLPRVCFIFLCIQKIIPFIKTCYYFPLPKKQKTKTSLKVGFPIRKFPDQRLLTPNRNLSQPATSFIASDCQGIHQMPFKTLEFKSRAGINPLLVALNFLSGLLNSRKRDFLSFVRHWRSSYFLQEKIWWTMKSFRHP